MKGGSSVSGRRAQSVIRVCLDPLLGDPREQIRRQTTDLPSNTFVRVSCRMKAIGLGFPIATHLDTAWYRSDLVWQFEASYPNTEYAKTWEVIANYLGGFNDTF
jgi:hypothetical protein